ncbi:MAG: hypothetical protein ACK50R_03425, partial [Planctomycetota bacterium]
MHTALRFLSLSCLLGFGLGLRAAAQETEPTSKRSTAKRIVFLGDSITHAGRYVAILEAALHAEYPDERIPEFINLGLP